MLKVLSRTLGIVVLLPLALLGHAEENMTQTQVDALIEELDEKTRFEGDYKAVAIAHSKNREKGESVQKIAIYRRDADKRLMLLFLAPKADAGKGYLMIDKNFFSYEPSTGSWTRVSDERVGGSALNRANFDGFNFSERYEGEFVAYEMLGRFKTARIKLKAKGDSDADEDIVELWVEAKDNNVLKQQDYARSGRLLRTTYRTNYKKFSDGKGNSQFVPLKTIVKDEVEVGNQTTMVIEQIDTQPLAANIFTKAWLESKSR